jgi:hypothetical protein
LPSTAAGTLASNATKNRIILLDPGALHFYAEVGIKLAPP